MGTEGFPDGSTEGFPDWPQGEPGRGWFGNWDNWFKSWRPNWKEPPSWRLNISVETRTDTTPLPGRWSPSGARAVSGSAQVICLMPCVICLICRTGYGITPRLWRWEREWMQDRIAEKVSFPIVFLNLFLTCVLFFSSVWYNETGHYP